MRNTTSIVVENVENFKVNLLSWAQQFNEVVWFDSNSDFGNFNQDYSRYDVVLAVEANSILNCNYKNAFKKLKAFQSNINDYIFGYLSYDLKNDIENLHSDHLNNLSFSDLFFFQPKKLFFLKDNSLEISYLKDHKNEIENAQKVLIKKIKLSGMNPMIFNKISWRLENIRWKLNSKLNSFKEFVIIFSPKTCFVLSSYQNRVKIRFE